VQAMLKRTRGRPRKSRYEAMPFMLRNDAAWMIYDARTGRMVAKPLHMRVARTLAHTLNLADLSALPKTFGDER
jgi:hypothetical protein